MNEKKTLLVDKSRMPLAMGIAFVAFTTQFGGGFASGAQIYQYFINYGIWCLILPALTQGLYALFFWYGMRYAYKHKTYDYRSFSNSLYGRTRPVMSNLYEVCYLIMIGTASAAAFATGGSTIQTPPMPPHPIPPELPSRPFLPRLAPPRTLLCRLVPHPHFPLCRIPAIFPRRFPAPR